MPILLEPVARYWRIRAARKAPPGCDGIPVECLRNGRMLVRSERHL
jgi:hypothetical protein